MSKAHYPYPDDEFDTPVDPEGPHGVHRAPRSAWSRWWPFLAVLVVVPSLTFGGVYLATRDGALPVLGSGTSASAATTGHPAAPSEVPSGGSTPSTASTPPSTAVLSTPVTVVNAAGIKGLAAKGQAKLTAAGFTSVTADNGDKGSLTQSTVAYGSADLAATAQRVATALGLTAVEQDDSVSDGIRVVLLKALS